MSFNSIRGRCHIKGVNPGVNLPELIPHSPPRRLLASFPQVHCCHLVVRPENEALVYTRERQAKLGVLLNPPFQWDRGRGGDSGTGWGVLVLIGCGNLTLADCPRILCLLPWRPAAVWFN